MCKIKKPLLAALGLMILFGLCSYVCAQEIQSQCDGGCAKQTFNLTGDQIEKILGPNSSADMTQDQIEKLLGSNESFNLMGDNNEVPLGSHDSPKYKAIVTLKSDQTKLKYSEQDLNLTKGLFLIIRFICHPELSNSVLPMQLKKHRDIFYVQINANGPCDVIWAMLLGSDGEILQARKNLTNIHMTVEIFRDQQHKKQCRDDDRRYDESQLPMAYIA
jgi:hypothetical protein